MKTSSIPANDVSVAQSSTADLSKVNLTVSHESYEPHLFRGDNTDRLTVSEWEESVRIYLSRRGIELCDQVEEVLNKLQEKAREVVKVGLLSKPSLDLMSGLQPMFDILRQQSVVSCIPLADFYDTKPYPTRLLLTTGFGLTKLLTLLWMD